MGVGDGNKKWMQATQRALLNANPIQRTKVQLASKFFENTMPESQDAEMDDHNDHISNASQAESEYHSIVDETPVGETPVGSPTSSGHMTPRATHDKFATDPAAFALPSGRIGHGNVQVPSTPQFGVSSWPVQSSCALRMEGTMSTSIPRAFQAQEHLSFSQEFQRTIPHLPRHCPDGDDQPLVPSVLGKRRDNHNRAMLFLPDPDSPLNRSHDMATPVS